MTSVQRFLANDRNLIRDAVLSASSVATSRALRTLGVNRQGNGRVRLAGDYTGHESATYDVEIAAGGTTLRASTPVIAGVGNGTLAVTGIAAPAVAETWTLRLVDLGTETTHAQIQVESITLRAQAAGAAGNSVRLTVTPDLTRADTAWSLLEDWPAGTETMAGAQFDFGGLPLSAKNELDATSPRLQWGHDYTVYRPYRVYQDGAWSCGLTPAPATAIPAGTRAYAVTGGYDIEVTDGVTTETHAGVVTFYDLCQALAASALVEVVGVVTADRSPGGMAMRDVPLRTSAWVLSATGTRLDSLAAAATAPTETITVECVNDEAVGDEVWQVTGTVSGVLGQATTGVGFSSPALSFTVPEPDMSNLGLGRYSTRFNPTTRTEGESLPSVCVRDFTLGVNARPGTFTFRYEERSDADANCNCTTVPISGRISRACLGLDGGEAMDADLKTRLTSIYSWRQTFFADNSSGHAFVAKADLDYADQVVNELTAALKEIYTDATALAEWDSAWTAVQSDFTALGETEAYEFFVPGYNSGAGWDALGGKYSSDGYGFWKGRVVVNPLNGHLYKVTDASVRIGTTYYYPDVVATPRLFFADAAVFKTDGTSGSVSDSYYKDPNTYFLSVTFLDLGVVSDLYRQWLADSAGNDASHEDGSVSITLLIAQLVRRHAARMDYVRILAGIDPKSDASGMLAGDGCWRDIPGTAGWWVDPNGDYFPAFSNTAYVSSKMSCGNGASADVPVGRPYSSKEFGFAIGVGCEDRLKSGDTISVTIDSIDGAKPYSVGAKAEIQVVTAGPAYLAGGVDGDDTQLWSVTGSATGAHPEYAVPTDGSAIPAYTDDGVTLQLAAGGIPHVLGDAWTFDIESGQFRWRKGSGAWSSLTDIEDEVALSEGVSARFEVGAAPSFVGGDFCRFDAAQPSAPSHLQVPTTDAWAWAGEYQILVADLGAVQTITALALARYDLPAGASVLIQGSLDGVDWSVSEALDVSGRVAVAILDTPWEVPYLRLIVANATGGRLGWLWAGEPLATTYHATRCRMQRAYAVQRGSGLNPARRLLGRGAVGEVSWDSDLTRADLDALMAMIEAMSVADQPWMILVPHYQHPDEADLVRVDLDRVEPVDYFEMQPDNRDRRMLSLALPFSAEYA